MHFQETCPGCRSADTKAWALSLAAHRLHHSQSLCSACGLVFSNPVAEPADLDAYYRSAYYETHWPQLLSTDAATQEAGIDAQRSEVARIQQLEPGGRLLEVGSGTGRFLAAARASGFEVWGIETSEAAHERAVELLGPENLFLGSVPSPELPTGFFDVVYVWHVIEHVTDLDAFIDALRAMLRPGGLLWVGTETYQNSTHYIERASHVLRALPPPFSTSDEHTVVFTRRTLSDSLSRRGFRVISCEAYQPDLEEKLRTMRFRNVFSRSYFLLQHALNAAFATGPLLRLAARKEAP